ncbi:MAG: phenylalanine--tRNA ligase subunit alpha [Nitrososphaerales archaeon]
MEIDKTESRIPLHKLEKQILSVLREKDGLNFADIGAKAQIKVDQVRRAIEWLKTKGLVNEQRINESIIELLEAGKSASRNGLPERRLLNFLRERGGKAELTEISSKVLSSDEASAAIGISRASKWIEVKKENGHAFVHLKGEPLATPEEELISTLSSPRRLATLTNKERMAYSSLAKRPGFILEVASKEVKIKLTKEGQSILIEEGSGINVTAPPPIIYSGRKHPLQNFMDEVKEIFVSLGFEEIVGPLVQSAFWNFDALFTPQDHPAREIQDTFYLRDSTIASPASPDLLDTVASVHQNGGATGSRGWGYKWNKDLTSRVVMRTHTTAVTVKYLADKTPEEARVFSVGRVFRNEKVTFKNLVEFHQIEGITVGSRVTLRDIMGLLSKFYERLGLKRVKFWPSFFPYTEPSLQSMVYNEKLSKWVELCGMGIFRPEVTRPLGVKNPVLAWGGGLERLVMLRYGLDDVRYLYENDLEWLRSVPLCP